MTADCAGSNLFEKKFKFSLCANKFAPTGLYGVGSNSFEQKLKSSLCE